MKESFAWVTFKDIALQIKEHGFFDQENKSSSTIEAWKRTFVSRLYYACFHESVELAEEITSYKKIPSHLDFHYNRHTAHGEVRAFYRKISKEYPLPRTIKTLCYQISSELKELHDMRKECDYTKEISFDDIDFFCSESLNFSKNILLNLSTIQEHFKIKNKLN